MFVKLGIVQVERVLDKDRFNSRIATQRIVEYDPEYVYVVVRALSANRPNSNGDCFPHEELVRLDPILHRPVYASFVGKGVYVNHTHTDDPRYAKGIILDSRYVQGSDDNYVELLLGIDRKKDPVFSRDVERGLINKFSMGASVQFTRCSVCGNEARRKEEFCPCIAQSKMREVKGADGEKKLAYELCYGVTFNELSAVSDPADETAQTLAKIAKVGKNGSITENSANPSHGTVVLLNDISARLKRLETVIMAKTAIRRTAAPIPSPADAAPPVDAAAPPMDDGALGGPPVEEGPGSEVVEVLKTVEDFVSGQIPAAEAVEALESIMGGGAEEPGMGGGGPGPQPIPEDMGGPVAKNFNAWLKRISKTFKEKKEGEMRKSAEDDGGKSSKIDNQYPYDKRQKDPKQFPNPAHDSRHKSRPSSDFASDAKEFAKKYVNVSAEFVPHTDKRLAGWRILDGETPLFMVTGANAWTDQLDEQWNNFSSRHYGRALVAAILEDGLEKTMTRVNAIEASKTTFDSEKLLKAAEAKASDLAAEMNEDFVVRFVEGIKLALKLQDKNVFDNPIKGAAWELFAKAGIDTALVDKIASGAVVEAHFDEAMKKALEYTEMSTEAFEEVKAQADVMAARSVTAASVETADDLAKMEEATREVLRRRASRNSGALNASQPGETAQKGLDTDIRSAVRVGIPNHNVPTKPVTFGTPRRPVA